MEFKREIERKFILPSMSYTSAKEKLKKAFPGGLWLKDQVSNDIFWQAANVDFIRLRENSRELTVKVSDKQTIVDRIEENVVVEDDSMRTAERLLTLLQGPPSLRLTKLFTVMDLLIAPAPGAEYRALVCLYKVKGDPKERVFLEVEAESLAVVDLVCEKLMGSFLMAPIAESLYSIFTRELRKCEKS